MLWIKNMIFATSIPLEIEFLKKLKILFFGGNGLVNTNPKELGLLENLKLLYLSNQKPS